MKNILISGSGEVGRYAAEVLQGLGHSITVIDNNMNALKRLENVVEARLVHGSACHSDVLREARISEADVLIAATSLDEVNLLTAAIGKKMGATKTIARVHHRSFIRSKGVAYAEAFDIDSLICPEELTSQSIVAKLHDPGVAAVQRFAGNEIELHQFTIRSDSEVFHRKLEDLALPSGVRIIIIRRGNSTIVPDAQTVLTRADVITILIPAKFLTRVKDMFHSERPQNLEVAISGATDISEWLLSELEDDRFSIRLFEPDLEIAEQVASRHPDITVLNSDPVDDHIFAAEHLDEVGSFIACCQSEEHNIMSALQAKKKGVHNTFAIIHNSSYLSSLEGIGIDYPFSPRIEGAKEILRLIDDSPVKVISSIDKSNILVYELKVEKGAQGAGLSLREINFPRATIIGAIERGSQVIAPSPSDVVEEGDTLVVIGPDNMEKTLKKMFI